MVYDLYSNEIFCVFVYETWGQTGRDEGLLRSRIISLRLASNFHPTPLLRDSPAPFALYRTLEEGLAVSQRDSVVREPGIVRTFVDVRLNLAREAA
uniref:Uncharacterized protein n=1 Tax=Mycena chlorophos TaxID=658473 RepID=A0ABQ0M0P7_MYCCL|nr:predicted protein [Mycena chlorophos]